MIVKSVGEGDRGILFPSSACRVAACTTLALDEIIKMSAFGGKPWISKEVERGGESPTWVVDTAAEKVALVGVGMS